jgi:hypothetical protein
MMLDRLNNQQIDEDFLKNSKEFTRIIDKWFGVQWLYWRKVYHYFNLPKEYEQNKLIYRDYK